MTMARNRGFPKLFFCIALVAIFFSAGSAAAIVKPGPGAETLLATYQRHAVNLKTSSFGLPLFLESNEQGDRVHVDVYGIFDYPFDSVVKVLNVPENWCGIVPLHPNVKACTSRKLAETRQLIFYVGRKNYQPPEDAHQVIYNYRIVAQQSGYLDVILSADDGPFGTRDHKMRFEALPLAGGKTFVHVSYEYSDSVALRLAAKAYFATLGRDKVGFTVTGTDKNGKEIYIGGPRGSIERNAVRYYFAIQTFMNHPEKSLFNARISQWYDYTIRYPKQLFDLTRKDYLAFKAREYKNQEALQRQIGPAR
jgi:hypothetical protein